MPGSDVRGLYKRACRVHISTCGCVMQHVLAWCSVLVVAPQTAQPL